MKVLVLFVFLFQLNLFSNPGNKNSSSSSANNSWLGDMNASDTAGIAGALGSAAKASGAGAIAHAALSGTYAYLGYSSLPHNKPAAAIFFVQSFTEAMNAIKYKDSKKKAHAACIKVTETNKCEPNLPSLDDIASDLGLPDESPFVDENGEALNYDDAFNDPEKSFVKNKSGKKVSLASLSSKEGLKDLGLSEEEINQAKNPSKEQLAQIKAAKDKVNKRLSRLSKRGRFGGIPFSSSGFDFQAALNSILKKKKILDLRTKKEGADKGLNAFKEVQKQPQIFLLVTRAYHKQMIKHEFLD